MHLREAGRHDGPRKAAEEMVTMAKGGARNRSGPQSDPNSIRSAQRGIVVTALPSEGYAGVVPAFPLPRAYRWNMVVEDKVKKREVDDGETEWFRERELEVWAEAWSTPQACAWAKEPWRWPTIAEFCRLKVIVETEPDGNASLVAQLHRFRDQIGLTPAGLKENGWAIAKNELAEHQADTGAPPAKRTAAKKTTARSRLKVVNSAAAG